MLGSRTSGTPFAWNTNRFVSPYRSRPVFAKGREEGKEGKEGSRQQRATHNASRWPCCLAPPRGSTTAQRSARSWRVDHESPKTRASSGSSPTVGTPSCHPERLSDLPCSFSIRLLESGQDAHVIRTPPGFLSSRDGRDQVTRRSARLVRAVSTSHRARKGPWSPSLFQQYSHL